MVHERDEKYDGHEDGEYHFSDDQVNYEIESEAVDQPVVSVKSTKPRDIFQQYKRPLIGVGVFVFLILLVYKISAPSTTTPASDFSPNTDVVHPQAKKAAPPAVAGQSNAFQPLAQPLGMSGSTSSGIAQPAVRPAAQLEGAATTATPAPAAQPVANPAIAMPTVQPPAAPVVTVVPSPVQPATSAPSVATVAQPAPAVVIQQEAPAEPIYNPVHPVADSRPLVVEPSELASVNQKLATMTQQNAKMQIDYKQKISDYEEKNSELQGKVQALNARIAGLEATLAHIDQSMQSSRAQANKDAAAIMQAPASTQVQVASMQPTESHVSYTVQAIIPGRAWLKSEGGETVTVAEGDTLKGYGRVMKIDPYDGVVAIDVGGKIVTLSYGVTSE